MDKPWGALDPNSQHQLWSRWTFYVYSGTKHPPFTEVREAFARWARMGFGSVGRAKVDEWRNRNIKRRDSSGRWSRQLERGYTLVVETEGRPAHDLGYRASVETCFKRDFVEKGWGSGSGAEASMEVVILAGDQQDGRPASQLLVMPTIKLNQEGRDG